MRIIKIGREYLKFDNGTYITSEHFTECCESHWADLLIMNDYNISTVTGEEIDVYEIEFAENIEDNIQLVKK